MLLTTEDGVLFSTYFICGACNKLIIGESHDDMSSIALDILLCLHLKSKDLTAHVSFANIGFWNIALC